MFKDILALIEQKIRAETSAENLNIPNLKELLEVHQFIKSRYPVSVEDVEPQLRLPAPSRPAFAVPGAGRAYGPSATEQMVDQMVSQLTLIFEKQASANQQPTLLGLAQSYQALLSTDPELAARVKILLDNKIKLEEERDEGLHSELSGRRDTGNGGRENGIELQGSVAPGGAGNQEVSQTLRNEAGER